LKEYLIISGFLDRKRKLVLTEDYLEWENGDLKGQEFTRLNKSDIVDFKHGVDWIVWYKFTVGQHFSITFKDAKSKELRIQFKSYFGFHKENNKKYADIVDDIWKLYHSNIVDSFLDRFYNQGEVEIHGVKLKDEGIEFREQNGLIPWDKLATKGFYRYFAIYHRDNSTIHLRVSHNEFGTETLWSAIQKIKKEKQIRVS
jgi:hypothetical protein